TYTIETDYNHLSRQLNSIAIKNFQLITDGYNTRTIRSIGEELEVAEVLLESITPFFTGHSELSLYLGGLEQGIDSYKEVLEDQFGSAFVGDAQNKILRRVTPVISVNTREVTLVDERSAVVFNEMREESQQSF
ncbi:MAG: hypothetical protein LRY71_10410, partial [Bacillaceae bacterium]|nr:hypothetical protein [Bacillaceae bacterium]